MKQSGKIKLASHQPVACRMHMLCAPTCADSPTSPAVLLQVFTNTITIIAYLLLSIPFLTILAIITVSTLITTIITHHCCHQGMKDLLFP